MGLKSLFQVALVLAVASSIVTALFADARAQVVPQRLSVRLHRPERYTLANGLKVVLQRDVRVAQVAVRVTYGVGYSDDPPGYASLAHLVEHLTFRGSRHVPPLAALSLLERAGATEVNAMTSLVETTYHSVIPAAALETALWIESDRMAFTLEKLNQQSLALERRVVMNELQLTGNDDFFDHELRALYPENHPYHPAALEPREVEKLKLPDVQWFFQRWYRPDNATLVIVGDFEPAQAKARVARYFGPIVAPRVPFSRARPARITLPAVRRLSVATPYEPGSASFTWIGPDLDGPDATALQMLTRRLERRLAHELIERKAWAREVDLSLVRMPPQSLVRLFVELAPKSDAARIETVVRDEIERLRSPLPEPELRSLRTEQRTLAVLSLEDLATRAAKLGRTGQAASLSGELAEIGRVNATRLAKIAERYLPLDRRLVAVFETTRHAPAKGRLDDVRDSQR